MDQDKAYNAFAKFAGRVRAFLDSQQSCSDLDYSDRWMNELNSLYGLWSRYAAQAKAMQSLLMKNEIERMEYNSDEWKKVKNSSTMLEYYVAGLHPKMWGVCEDIISLGYVLRTSADNTRTLMSSHRQEREIESRTQVRQTASN